MKKVEMLNKLEDLLQEKGMARIDGITANSRKKEIQTAIDCLEVSDERLAECLEIVKAEYPNIHATIVNNGDWKRHSYNRYFVYTTALILQ